MLHGDTGEPFEAPLVGEKLGDAIASYQSFRHVPKPRSYIRNPSSKTMKLLLLSFCLLACLCACMLTGLLVYMFAGLLVNSPFCIPFAYAYTSPQTTLLRLLIVVLKDQHLSDLRILID
jgi:hypothetical protein